MGKWGNELYQNDTSLDVKQEFEKRYNNEKNVQHITEAMIEEYKSIFDDNREEALFWISLADAQFDCGVLLPLVKKRALYWISVELTNSFISKKSLNTVLLKLSTVQPSIKNAKEKELIDCKWNNGDTFAYRNISELAKEKGMNNYYFIIRKIDEYVWDNKVIVPIVYVKISGKDELPLTENDYDRLHYVQTWFTRYEDRFYPIDMNRPNEDIIEKSKKTYITDEYGFLPQYRLILLNTSKRVVPKQLIYLGNYTNVANPNNEFIPNKDNMVVSSWKSFEVKMINRYYEHNLRELQIYKTN